MKSAAGWHLDDLFAMFPDVSRGTDRVLRCLWRTSGEGRCIKEEADVRCWSTVSLSARPAGQFVLRLTHSWPVSLGAPDRQAIQLACEFAPTRSPVFDLRLVEGCAEATLILEEKHALGRARDTMVISTLVGLWKIGGTLTARDPRGSADFRFAKPAYFERFARSMPGEVRFSRPEHCLRFDPALLDLPLAQADPIALKLAREQCERELQQLQQPGDFVARLGPLILSRDGGYRSAEELAEALHTSARTLKRRLKEQGTSYSEILDRTRCAKATQLLSVGWPVAQIAAALGYSDAANFTRAFRRWTGRTPAASRSPNSVR